MNASFRYFFFPIILADLPGRVEGIACHVGDRKQLKNLVDFTIRKFGRLDVLVSNAAVNPEAGQILDISETALDKLLQINIKSAIVLCQEAIPKMVAGGSVIFVSSYTAFQPSPPIAAYAVTKTALLGLTKALADELGHQNIRVNCIAPGIVPTKFASALVASPEAEKLNKEKTLLGRLGTAEDMASTVAFLASSDASYITGETIVVAGGMQSRL